VGPRTGGKETGTIVTTIRGSLSAIIATIIEVVGETNGNPHHICICIYIYIYICIYIDRKCMYAFLTMTGGNPHGRLVSGQ
jgi:hypothetical protein